MARITKKLQEVLDWFLPDENGFSRWVPISDVQDLGWAKIGNGLFRNGRPTFCTKLDYKWEKRIEKNTIVAIRMAGFDNKSYLSDAIPPQVIDDFMNQEGDYVISNMSLLPLNKSRREQIEIDHRWGRKQDIEHNETADFQILSSQENVYKREVCKKCKATDKRPNPLGFFIEGCEDYQQNVGCKGCYYAEPERYRINVSPCQVTS